MSDHRLSRPERIRRLVKRVGVGAALVAILLWLLPFGLGGSEVLLGIALVGVAAAWSAASGGRFSDSSGGDAGSDWGDVESSDGGGDAGDGGD